jgi:hypothetical protein
MKMKNRMKRSDKAAVGIVVAVLLIGLALAVIAMIKTVYVPQWLEKTEAEHMQHVSNQFAQIKHAIDLLSAVEQDTQISTYITLNSEDIPIFGGGRTYGSLEIIPDNLIITFANVTDSFSYSVETIKFTSGNTYFVDQAYIYEAGALIRSQSTANIMYGTPYLSVSNFTNLSITLVNISGVDGKRAAVGFGTYALQTEYLSSRSLTMINITTIDVTTNYQNAWRVFFNNSLLNSGLDYTIEDIANGISVEFSGSLGILFLKVVRLSAQIAPGWIE